MKRFCNAKTAYAGMQRGFTLVELSIVIMLIGVAISMGPAVLMGSPQASQFDATVTRIDTIEKALLDYAIANNHIPCPSDLTQTASSSPNYYGLEAGAGSGSAIGAGTGVCTGTGMLPRANFKAASGAVEGGVPTRALKLADDYMYDGWGRRFRYAVDPAYTAVKALPFPTGGLCTASASGITVRDASGAVRTAAGIYALVSHGSNGHGGYTSDGVPLNAGSVNANELTNCHCTSAAVAGPYTPSYVETVPTQDSANALNNFDDIVAFKEGSQMQAPNYPLAAKLQCTVVYVADGGNNRVQMFDGNGSYVGQIGCATGACAPGSGNGQFNNNTYVGMSLDASGNLWVVDNGIGRVQEFNSGGNYLNQFPLSIWSRDGIAIDPSGNIWVVGTSANLVDKFNSRGALLQTFGSSGSGNGQFNSPRGIAINASGNLWVVDNGNNRVQEFNGSGSYLSQFGSGSITTPGSIAVDAGGNFWVTGVNVVEKFNNSGTYVSQFGKWGTENGQFKSPYAIAIDASGNLWVVDNGNNRVQKFSSGGTYLGQIGCATGGCSGGTANGEFNNSIGPLGIAVGTR